MFILTKFSDLVQISPEDFSKHSIVAIEDNINAKYANKVSVSAPYSGQPTTSAKKHPRRLIGHGTGLVNVNVEFRMIVFRPFKGEVMLGRIRSSTPSGIHLRTDFFDDIFVPYEELPQGAEYNHSEQIWIWNFDEERLFYDNHEMVRFQVIDEEWHDQTPAGPTQAEDTPAKTPYKIKGSMAAEGLGVCLWWDGA
ncbi:dna-directed rna polymerase iii subunit rpc8 [Trichoderma arundinaceum]|uniref:DNA-directed RNA polymerase subunit n=1 Tax=Trichoderma arundinaceum TaxID=490622 RepID=A0A395NJH0_TRIAR|nr:dna-directed rna polymerase iii subunit rpc8 [Trichoderma arundinaceum]